MAISDEELEGLRSRLAHHPLYDLLDDIDSIRLFMAHHVFPVWDFMSLVKSLQRDLTCVDTPWIPVEDTEAARLINEIVLGEETDERRDSGYASHLDLYLEGMRDLGADRGPITSLIDALKRGEPFSDALEASGAPEAAKAFTRHTINLVEQGPLHVRAAALFYGRESLIPAMFRGIVERAVVDSQQCAQFLYYLDRHIEVDEGSHSILAERLVDRLCGGSSEKRDEVRVTWHQVLTTRMELWDRIADAIRKRQPQAEQAD